MVNDVIIASGTRTAIGDFGGGLSSVAPSVLATAVAVEAISRAGINADAVQQAIFGNVIHTEPRDMYLSRVAAINAGVPEAAPALTLNRLCGSGLQSVITASEQIALGFAEIVLAGGAESMSRAGHLMTQVRSGTKMGDVKALDMMLGALSDPFGNGHMGVTAENVAREDEIDRAMQDAFALESHRRAGRAIREGRFASQILPITVSGGREEVIFETDEHVRPNLTEADLKKLRPAFVENGSVTAGNASGLNDGAAALILMSMARAEREGVRPIARVVATGLSGVDPSRMGLGPVPAVAQAMDRAGLHVDDMDVIESNEAFAAQACAVSQRLGFSDERTNPNGGAVALGHPIGATGAILLVKLVHELARIDGHYGLVTMCIGGGQGIAMIVERL